jgi:hypothetical protein
MARFQSTIINAETPLRLMNKGNGICPPVFQRHGKCKPIHPLSTPRRVVVSVVIVPGLLQIVRPTGPCVCCGQ